MRRSIEMPMVIAALVFVAAAAVFGSTVVDAVRLGDTESAGSEGSAESTRVPPTSDPNSEALRARLRGEADAPAEEDLGNGLGSRFSDAADPVLSYEALLDAVSVDPFLPNRAPARPYQLPGDRTFRSPRAESAELPEAPEFRIVGTALLGSGGLALVQVEEEMPVALSVGESLRGYRLASVDADRAMMVGAAGRLNLPVMEARPIGGDRRRENNRSAEREREAQIEQLLRGQRNGLNIRTLIEGMGGVRGGRGGGARGGRGGRGGGGVDGF